MHFQSTFFFDSVSNKQSVFSPTNRILFAKKTNLLAKKSVPKIPNKNMSWTVAKKKNKRKFTNYT